MGNSKTTSVQIGPGLLGVLGVAFIILRLCEVIDWSWWWVTAPLWMPLALVLVILVGLGLFCAVVALACALFGWWTCGRT